MEEVVFNKSRLKPDEITEVLDKARIVLRNTKGEFVLCRFNRVYFLPGGKIEQGETPKDTLITPISFPSFNLMINLSVVINDFKLSIL